MAKPLQGFNAMQSDRVIPTTDPRSFRGGQVATPEQRGQRLRGMGEGYLSSIMDLPMRGMEALAPDAGYTPGELRSSPQDRARGQRYAWEDYQQGQAQDPDYSLGMDLGEDIALVADPFFDIPLAGAAKMAPYAAKALRSETLGADALSGMRGLLGGERGAVGDVSDFVKSSPEYKSFSPELKEQYARGELFKPASHGGRVLFHGTTKDAKKEILSGGFKTSKDLGVESLSRESISFSPSADFAKGHKGNELVRYSMPDDLVILDEKEAIDKIGGKLTAENMKENGIDAVRALDGNEIRVYNLDRIDNRVFGDLPRRK